MTQIPSFETVAKAHGHTCPGIALGYKIAVVAAEWADTIDDIHILSHTTRCPLDAVKVTFDTKNHPERLTVEDTNTVSLVFTKPDGSRLCIDELPGTHLSTDELTEIKKKVENHTATPDDLSRMNRIKDDLFRIMKEIPNEQLFSVHEEVSP